MHKYLQSNDGLKVSSAYITALDAKLTLSQSSGWVMQKPVLLVLSSSRLLVHTETNTCYAVQVKVLYASTPCTTMPGKTYFMSNPPPPTHVTGLPFCFVRSSSTEVQPDAVLLPLCCNHDSIQDMRSQLKYATQQAIQPADAKHCQAEWVC